MRTTLRSLFRQAAIAALASAVSVLAVTPPGAAQVAAKLASTAPTTHPDHKALLFLAERVAEKTTNQLKIAVFPGSQLGGEREVAEGLTLGAVELGAMSNAILGNFEPTLQIFDLPFLFRDREHAFRVLDGPMGAEMRDNALTRGLRILAFLEFGFRYVHNSKRPIVTPADMQGLKFRVIQNPVHIGMYEALGARAIPMPRPEVYSALKQGVIDGLDNALVWYETMGDYEVAKYLTLGVPFLNTVGALVASERWHRGLAPEVQRALAEAALDFRTRQRQLFHEEEGRVLARVQQKGVVVIQGNYEAFRQPMLKVWDQFAPKVGGMEKIRAIADHK